jgi:hypothetical protein
MVRIKQLQLLDELRTRLGGSGRRLTAVADGPAGVEILHNGHCRGVWHWQGRACAFTPAGYGTPTYAAATAEDAARYTLEHFAGRGAPAVPAALRTTLRSGPCR